MSIASKFLAKAKLHKQLIEENYTASGGLYSSVVVNYTDAEKFFNRLRNYLPDIKPDIKDAHITVIYSETKTIPFETAMELAQPEPSDYPYEALIEKLSVFKGHNDKMYLVAEVSSKVLEELHNKWVQAGYKHSIPEYNPHITIEKDTTYTEQDLIAVNDMLLARLYTVPFNSEVIEDLKD